MKIIDEFKEFALKGNVVDLAIGVIIGAAFAPVVSSLVDNIMMPPIGYLLAGIDFSNLSLTLPTPTEDNVEIRYGVFMNAVIKFFITALAVFAIVKVMNTLRRPAPAAAPPSAPQSEVYLREIRDALVKRA